jgi:hypothetical protein
MAVLVPKQTQSWPIRPPRPGHRYPPLGDAEDIYDRALGQVELPGGNWLWIAGAVAFLWWRKK